jgi:hypothetical protein
MQQGHHRSIGTDLDFFCPLRRFGHLPFQLGNFFFLHLHIHCPGRFRIVLGHDLADLDSQKIS